MEKIYIDYSDKIYTIQKYLEDNKVNEIYLKVISINEKGAKNNIFNENILSVYFENEGETRERVPIKYFKTLLKENGRNGCSYFCFFEKEELEEDINEEEIYEFLKNGKEQLRENLLNWDEDKIYFIELKKLSRQYKEKIMEELIQSEESSYLDLYNSTRQEKNKKLIADLKNNKEKILNYLENISPKLGEEIKDILDIKYLVSYNEKKMKAKLEEKEVPFKETLQIAIANKELIKKIDDTEIMEYFSRSYFKQAFYLYLKYMLLLKPFAKEGERVKLENSGSNQSDILGIKILITPYKNNLYIEKLKKSKINTEEIKKLKNYFEEYWGIKNKIRDLEIKNIAIENVDFIKKLKNNYVIKDLNSPIFRVKIVPIFELENLENSKLYYIATKNTDYLGLYNKVLSELKNGSYIFENSEAKERTKIFDKEEIDEVGEVVGIYFN